MDTHSQRSLLLIAVCHSLWLKWNMVFWLTFNPLNAELNPICHLLALLGAHHILHVSRIRVKNRASYI